MGRVKSELFEARLEHDPALRFTLEREEDHRLEPAFPDDIVVLPPVALVPLEDSVSTPF